MRLIDADELKALYDDSEFVGEKWHVPIRVILANIDDMPTIDPPKELVCSVNVNTDEIIEKNTLYPVRCKYCKHYKQSNVADRKMCFRKDIDGVPVCYDFLPDDWCKYGERRTDE